MAAQSFYYTAEGHESGPVDSRELRRLAEAGIVRPETLVRQGDSGRWVRAEQVRGLFQRSVPAPSSSLGASPPGPPPLPPPVPESGAPSRGVSGESPIRHGLGAAAVNEEVTSSLETEVRRLLAEGNRIRAIGECRQQLKCEFDPAHKIVRLIADPSCDTQAIRDAMQKAAHSNENNESPPNIAAGVHGVNIPRDQVGKDLLARLQSLANGHDETVHVFRSCEMSGLLPYVFAAAAAVVYVICLWNTAKWDTFLVLVAAGVVIAYLVTWAMERAIWHLRIGREFVMCNPMFFIAVRASGIMAKPLWKLTDCRPVKTEEGVELRSYFGKDYISIPFLLLDKEQVATFASYLLAFKEHNLELLREKPLAKRLASGDWSEWGNADVFPEIAPAVKFTDQRVETNVLATFFRSRARRLIAAGVAVPLCFFLVSRIIDYNAFRAAEEVGTATAYRTYLAEQHNVLYREKARTATKALYDKHIREYSARAGHLRGATAFVEVLRYLRDRDLYEIPIAFERRSNVRNLRTSGLSRIIPIEPSFTAGKNRDREQQVISRVNQTLGRFFPTDIATAEPWAQQEGPKVVVAYTYSNKPNSFYYPESEQFLPQGQRTWYYGIEINWRVAVYVPGRTPPVYTFQLGSEPAPQFTTTSEGADPVYDKMALTAFDDFVDEFNGHFLDARSNTSPRLPAVH